MKPVLLPAAAFLALSSVLLHAQAPQPLLPPALPVPVKKPEAPAPPVHAVPPSTPAAPAPPAAPGAPTPAARTSTQPLELKGTQTERIVTLAKAGAPHLVTGDYVVPEGYGLTIGPGTLIAFARNAALTVQGTLTIEGTSQAPVVFAGKVTGADSWEGLRLVKSSSATIVWLRVTGAKNGISLNGTKPLIDSAHLHGNTVGIRIGEIGSASEPTLRNCLITDNKEDGVQLWGGKALLERCTLQRNGGWGLRGEYYASPKFTACRVTGNREGGMWLKLYQCKAQARDSIFADNGKNDLYNESPEPWDFSGNWWGPSITQQLQKKGDTADLPSIRDGRDRGETGKGQVSLAGFLTAEPAACGSTIAAR